MKKTIICAALLLLTGCASITKGTTQTVTVDTPRYPGAMCTLTSPEIGTQSLTTPGQLTLSKSKHNISVSCQRGCMMGTATITSNTESMTVGNIIAGGVIGLGVDAASGAMNKYSDPTHVTLYAPEGCKG